MVAAAEQVVLSLVITGPAHCTHTYQTIFSNLVAALEPEWLLQLIITTQCSCTLSPYYNIFRNKLLDGTKPSCKKLHMYCMSYILFKIKNLNTAKILVFSSQKL